MEGVLIFIAGYVIFLFFWLLFVLLFFALSFIFKKNLVTIPVGITYLISFGIQLYIFGYSIYLLWQIISNGEWLLLVLAFVFGGFIIGLWQTIYSFLLAPFIVLATYFLEKVEDTDFGENITAAEILDKDNNVVGVIEGETTIKVRLAKYFLAVYALPLASLLIFPVEREGLAPIDYFTKPFFQIISLTMIVGIPYGIFRKIKRKSFFTKDKRYFLIQTWKIGLYIFIPLLVIVYFLALGTNTL